MAGKNATNRSNRKPPPAGPAPGASGPPPNAASAAPQGRTIDGQQMAAGLAAVLEVVNGCEPQRERQLREQLSLGVRVIAQILGGQIQLSAAGQQQNPGPAAPAPPTA